MSTDKADGITRTHEFRPGRDGWQGLRDILARNDNFHNSTKHFRGMQWDSFLPAQGHMPHDDYQTMRKHWIESETGFDYVIFSYGTVIAYRLGDVWFTPNATYSVTTTRHQNMVLTAISQL